MPPFFPSDRDDLVLRVRAARAANHRRFLAPPLLQSRDRRPQPHHRFHERGDVAQRTTATLQQIADLEAPGRSGPAAAPAQLPPPAETFARDAETVARIDNRPLDPAMQGFMAIPGTPARVKVDGYAKLDSNIDTKPAGNPDRFVPSTIPIGLSDAQQTASSTMHVRQTRINVDFRIPT